MRWWDRERRIRTLRRRLRVLRIIAKVKGEASAMWFRHYQRSLVERSELQQQVVDADEMVVEEMRRAVRNLSAWRSARARAGKLQARVRSLAAALEAARAEHTAARKHWYEERGHLAEAKKFAEIELASMLVPAPSTPVNPDDRAGLYRLEDENTRLRARVQELEAKYEGNPS